MRRAVDDKPAAHSQEDDAEEDDDAQDSRIHVTDKLSRLDDEDYPAVSMGQAAQLLDVQPAFLRSLDTAGIVSPSRTDGGHRRYSRRQLRLATRLRTLLDAGHSLLSAQTILALEQRLDATESARHHAADARNDATEALGTANEALDAARADLRRRDAELITARHQLDHARRELSELHVRLAARKENPGCAAGDGEP